MERTLPLASLLILSLSAALHAADVAMETQSWANADDAFAEFEERIQKTHARNLLARKKVKCVEATGVAMSGVRGLVDGAAGVRGHEGRVGIGGNPSAITLYLGELKPVTEVGVYTFNIDARSNQDWEVRFANNSQQPGVKPTFEGPPTFSTGAKVIGANRGGFHAWFRAKDGSDIVPGKADWLQFRIWRTYNVKAGSPAKAGNTAHSWASAIELEVLGHEDDVLVLSKEEIARRKALRQAPRKPKYEKKDTWQETMVAAREAIVEWECLHDALAMPDSGVVYEPWHAIGPVSEKEPLVAKIEKARRIDLDKPYKAKDGKMVPWVKRPDFKDGETIDLSQHFKANEGDVVFLCRSFESSQKYDRRRPYAVSLGLHSWYVRVLPQRWTRWAPKPAEDPFPNQIIWQWNINAGKYQVLVKQRYTKGGKWAVWFCPMSPTSRPGAGSMRSRQGRREGLFRQVPRDFPDPVAQEQMKWEQLDSVWFRFRRHSMSRIEKFLSDWPAGKPEHLLIGQYAARIKERAEALLTDELSENQRRQLADWIAKRQGTSKEKGLAKLRSAYYDLATLKTALAERRRIESLRLAIEDQRDTFEAQYPKTNQYLARVGEFERQAQGVLARVLGKGGEALVDVLKLRADVGGADKEILLANPLLGFEKLLLISGGPGFSSNWGGANRLGRAIEVLSPVRPDGKLTAIHKGTTCSMDLSFDAKKILFSDGKGIFEINVDGTSLRQITDQGSPLLHYDPCYMPNGKIMFVSNACEQAVPCTGGANVGNMHVMDADGKNERRIAYDQDHNWNPVLMQDGRVLYSRWEYNDTPHYFSRLLFQMYPDGTNQMEYYGSNSYWPNAMYWPQPIPGHSSAVVCIVSGHHGVPRMGELVLLDPALGRHEADGVIQRIPGRGKKVEPVIMDGLVSESWPRFATPYPLAEPVTHRGAGKYFLVTCKMDPVSPWGLYLVDVFDNMTPLLMGGYSMPTPLRPRPRPPVLKERIDLSKKDALVYMADVYAGDGLRGYPRGSIKALRVSSVHYRFAGNGDTRAASYEGGWDVKKILGTVPVYEDGSAMFHVPANMPIVVQPLDEEGKAQQQMRSWYTAMPGEKASCVGCHEPQNAMPSHATYTMAMQRKPSKIKAWYGPTRGFSFDREVQPVLDHRCAGCHNGQPRKDGGQIPDFRAKRLHKDYKGHYSPAYLALHPYVRRAGYEADYHLLAPAEFEADTGQLVQMLKKGHHGVTLTREEWDRIYTWIDLNIPYPLNWRESHRPPKDEQVERRVKYKKLFANISDRDEESLPLPPVAKFEPPGQKSEVEHQKSEVRSQRSAGRPECPQWPFSAEDAARRQKECVLKPQSLDLSGNIAMTFVPVPAGAFVMGDPSGFPDERQLTVAHIDQPFWIAQFEVTNEQYAHFDPAHDSGVMEGRFKDRYTRGTPVNAPKDPVIRVSWNQAVAFCNWLSKKTGQRCTLPTEAQWEWACRAGTATPFHFGEKKPGLQNVGNFSDEKLSRWNWGRIESGYNDGASFSTPGGRYKPNAWGLHDMHGNVAEWCLDEYRPPGTVLPGTVPNPTEVETEGTVHRRTVPNFRVVRGGSWNDTMRFCRSASRWRYEAHKPVYNVGFRVVCLPPQAVAAAR